MKRIFIRLLTILKNLIIYLDNLEHQYACNLQVTNNGTIFYRSSKIQNLQGNAANIILGTGSHIRGNITLFSYGGKIEIGDNCYIGENSNIWSSAHVKIGNCVLISHNVNIMDTNAHELNAAERAESYQKMLKQGHPLYRGNVLDAPISIEDDAWIGFNAVILKGVIIGKGAIVSAGSIVTKDVAPYTMVAGNPAQFIKELDN